MNKTIYRLAYVFLLFSFVACQSEEDVIKSDPSKFSVPVEVAKKLAIQVDLQNPYTTIRNSNYRSANMKEIDWVQPVANENGEVGCYVINFQDQKGYMILS